MTTSSTRYIGSLYFVFLKKDFIVLNIYPIFEKNNYKFLYQISPNFLATKYPYLYKIIMGVDVIATSREGKLGFSVFQCYFVYTSSRFRSPFTFWSAEGTIFIRHTTCPFFCVSDGKFVGC